MLSKSLEETLRRAMTNASSLKHEFATLEHLLFALLEDQDAMRDAQRNMAWFALAGMLLYPSLVVFAYLINLDTAGKVLGDMAATYFVSVAAIVAAFYGKEALINKSK